MKYLSILIFLLLNLNLIAQFFGKTKLTTDTVYYENGALKSIEIVKSKGKDCFLPDGNCMNKEKYTLYSQSGDIIRFEKRKYTWGGWINTTGREIMITFSYENGKRQKVRTKSKL
ncbi:MAG: hypothetical protein H6600_04410 [Flavobacteriales bacterium]|nr:hypothetical protein [Flavobacteriales bacterium]